jgi:hypothetical protein
MTNQRPASASTTRRTTVTNISTAAEFDASERSKTTSSASALVEEPAAAESCYVISDDADDDGIDKKFDEVLREHYNGVSHQKPYRASSAIGLRRSVDLRDSTSSNVNKTPSVPGVRDQIRISEPPSWRRTRPQTSSSATVVQPTAKVISSSRANKNESGSLANFLRKFVQA